VNGEGTVYSHAGTDSPWMHVGEILDVKEREKRRSDRSAQREIKGIGRHGQRCVVPRSPKGISKRRREAPATRNSSAGRRIGTHPLGGSSSKEPWPSSGCQICYDNTSGKDVDIAAITQSASEKRSKEK